MWSKFEQICHQSEADRERIATSISFVYIVIANMNIKCAFKFTRVRWKKVVQMSVLFFVKPCLKLLYSVLINTTAKIISAYCIWYVFANQLHMQYYCLSWRTERHVNMSGQDSIFSVIFNSGCCQVMKTSSKL